ncbi:hypothetical protein [Streptomyces sp. NPDC054975]
MTQPDSPSITALDGGPALIYVGSTDAQDVRLINYADRGAIEDPRERALCRALLVHALALLDATEPTSPTGASAR